MESINALGEIVMSTGAVLGTRQMARYYKQRPRPAETRESVLISAMVQVRQKNNAYVDIFVKLILLPLFACELFFDVLPLIHISMSFFSFYFFNALFRSIFFALPPFAAIPPAGAARLWREGLFAVARTAVARRATVGRAQRHPHQDAEQQSEALPQLKPDVRQRNASAVHLLVADVCAASPRASACVNIQLFELEVLARPCGLHSTLCRSVFFYKSMKRRKYISSCSLQNAGRP